MATEILIKSAEVKKPEDSVATDLPSLETSSEEISNGDEVSEAVTKETKVEDDEGISESVTVVDSETSVSVPSTNLNTITISGATVPMALASVEGQSISLATPVVSGQQVVNPLTAGYQLLLQQQYLNFLQLQQSMIQMSNNVSINCLTLTLSLQVTLLVTLYFTNVRWLLAFKTMIAIDDCFINPY